ncbi:hypothetical protein GCM10025867_15510 [Frondihabitans sucicola]|uniref:histidine kinase n=1 Tax=Frondihabitans sucicola TaxID=1268041 RepID=A0ABM8GLL7_9MICO|nr:hypothetical protein GCM10025867_15510 [Frondihabitans sucicola]
MHTRLSQWWNEISIRTKITGITVCLVTLGLLVAGLGTMTVLSTYLYGQVDRDLTTASKAITKYNGDSDHCSADFGIAKSAYIAIVADDGTLLCTNIRDLDSTSSAPYLPAFTERATAAHKDAFNGYNKSHTEEWRLYAVHTAITNTATDRTEALTVVTGQNLASTNATIARFTYIFLGFGLSVVVLGAAITRLLVTSTFAPLRDVEDTAARFADGDFSQRLDTTSPNTEVGRLNRSLNTMLSRIDSAFDDRAKTIDQMRRFVGDASHELRTPLVSLRGYAELYRMGALTKPEDVAQAMDRIEKEAIRMGGLVQDLLQLARLDESKPLELGPVDLVTIARDSALDTMASNTDREIRVIVREPVAPGAATTEEYVIPRRRRRLPGRRHRPHRLRRGDSRQAQDATRPGHGRGHPARGAPASRRRRRARHQPRGARRREQDPPGRDEPHGQRDAIHRVRLAHRARRAGRPGPRHGDTRRDRPRRRHPAPDPGEDLPALLAGRHVTDTRHGRLGTRPGHRVGHRRGTPRRCRRLRHPGRRRHLPRLAAAAPRAAPLTRYRAAASVRPASRAAPPGDLASPRHHHPSTTKAGSPKGNRPGPESART